MLNGIHVVTSFTEESALELCQLVRDMNITGLPQNQVIIEGVGGDMRARTRYSGDCNLA